MGILSVAALPVPSLISQTTNQGINKHNPIELNLTGSESYHTEFLTQLINEHFTVNPVALQYLFNKLTSDASGGQTQQNAMVAYDLKLAVVAHIVTDDGNIESAVASSLKYLLTKPMSAPTEGMETDTPPCLATLDDSFQVCFYSYFLFWMFIGYQNRCS